MKDNSLISLIKNIFKDNKNIVKNSIKIGEEEYSAREFSEEFNKDNLLEEQKNSENIASSKLNIVDNRENLEVDTYLMSEGYMVINSEKEKRKDIYTDIVNSLDEKLHVGKEVNNKKISISRNYIAKEDTGKNGVANWAGWHSLAEDKVSKANNFKYYIFCVREETSYYTIIFEKESFQNYLKLKELDKSGKYNFYFTGFV